MNFLHSKTSKGKQKQRSKNRTGRTIGERKEERSPKARQANLRQAGDELLKKGDCNLDCSCLVLRQSNFFSNKGTVHESLNAERGVALSTVSMYYILSRGIPYFRTECSHTHPVFQHTP